MSLFSTQLKEWICREYNFVYDWRCTLYTSITKLIHFNADRPTKLKLLAWILLTKLMTSPQKAEITDSLLSIIKDYFFLDWPPMKADPKEEDENLKYSTYYSALKEPNLIYPKESVAGVVDPGTRKKGFVPARQTDN